MKEEIGEFISMTEFAKRMGCSITAVQKAINNGRIERCADRTIYWPTQSVAWEKNRNESQVRNGVVRHAPAEVMGFIESGGTIPDREEPDDEDFSDDDDDDGEEKPYRHPFAPKFGPDPYADSAMVAGSLGHERLRKERSTADLKELDYAVRSGQVVNKDIVVRARYAFCRTVRDAILNIPNRVSSEVGADISRYIEHLITSTVSEDVAATIIGRIDLGDVERIVSLAWTKESRYVLENIGKFENSNITT